MYIALFFVYLQPNGTTTKIRTLADYAVHAFDNRGSIILGIGEDERFAKPLTAPLTIPLTFISKMTNAETSHRGRLSERSGERLEQPLMWLKCFVYKGFKGIE